MAASTRSTRSRYSSPHRNGPLEPSKSSANEGSKTFLDKWLEPTVQHRPSFEDHGLVRFGVVEGMAPLGELPKQPTLQKRKGQEGGHHPVRRIILRQSNLHAASSSPAPAPPTPTPTVPATPASGSDVARQESREQTEVLPEETQPQPQKQQRCQAGEGASKAAKDAPIPSREMPSSPPTVVATSVTRVPSHPAMTEKPASNSLPGGRDADDELVSRAGSVNTGRSGTPLARRSLPRVSAGQRTSGSPSHNLSASVSSTSAPATHIHGNAVQPYIRFTLPVTDKRQVDQIVEAAVDEAIRHYRYPTAWALRTLYDENSSDPHFLWLFVAVFNQTADPQSLQEFSRLIHAKKREGKKGNQACYYFVPPTTNSRFTPHKAKHAPYRRYITLDFGTLQHPDGFSGIPQQQIPQAHQQADQLPPQVLAQPSFSAPEIQQPQFRLPDFSKQPEPTQPETKEPEVKQPDLTIKQPDFQRPEPQETPSKRKHRSRRSRHSPKAMDLSTGDAVPTTPSRKRGRRGSASSDSSALTELENSPSLPSPTPVARRDAQLEVAGVSEKVEAAPNDLRPIRRSRASAAAAHQAAGTSQPASPTAPTSTSDLTTSNSNMPGRVSSPMFPNLTKSKTANSKKPSPPVIATPAVDDDEAVFSRRRDARALTRSRTPRVDSSVRASAAPAVSNDNHEWDQREIETPSASVKARKTRNSNVGPAAPPPSSTRVTRSIKRNIDEVDGTISPTASSFPGDAAPSVPTSRAATPNLMPAAKKQRTSGLRVKSSPVKKKGGTAAGLPRPSGEGHQSTSNGVPNGTDDNDEYCSACGGVGDLVCCETCPRSFHFNCVDLGMNGELPEEWYCNVCIGNRNPPKPVGPRGGFGRLLTQLDKVNNQSFKLPYTVQTFFEGVKPGAEGDYEEATAAGPKVQKKKGYDEAPDFFKLRDLEGAAVLCHDCQHPSEDNRAIIPCSLCGLFWHLDCLDPPMAIPPVLRTWICPAHADDLLAQLPTTLAPAHKFRKIKGAPTIIPDFERGMRNNGVIEVYDEPEDESGWNDMRSFGRVYRLPANGIKLDFIAQLRKEGAGYISRPVPPPNVEQTASANEHQTNEQSLSQRSVMEAQAALNLASLRQPEASGLDQLTDALIDNADESILALMARGNAVNLASGELQKIDQQSLRAMLAHMEAMSSQIKSLLAPGDKYLSGAAAAQGARMRTPNDAASPPTYSGLDEDATKTEYVEADIPTPATYAHDTVECVNGIIGKSSPANDSAMDLD